MRCDRRSKTIAVIQTSREIDWPKEKREKTNYFTTACSSRDRDMLIGIYVKVSITVATYELLNK